MLFDSHAHLDDDKFNGDREAVISKIAETGISYVVNVGSDMESSIKSVELSSRYPFIYAAVGIHPYDADQVNDETIERLRRLADNPKVVAIGETGLDYHFDDAPRQVQIQAFRRQIKLADELGLPVIIHDREAHHDMMEVLVSERPANAIIHCYSGSVEMAEELVKMGYYISFSGTVTYKNAVKLKDVAAMVPDDKLLIETDSPYLAPEPVRGTRNDSVNVRYTAEKIAQIRGTDFQTVAQMTSQNAKRVYGIDE